jgi:hypothetical protein
VRERAGELAERHRAIQACELAKLPGQQLGALAVGHVRSADEALRLFLLRINVPRA